ncbi:conserved hypothetical protein [Leishmania infantum JPCM5]|uniref:Ubiquitin-like domain-containing protein n=2 Tax=Leishmania infantum TaxID=5671 RepID=A4HYY5_LEIIN|nr:conserved hypothetical protein [Leishmania infantum JPCM5]CAC9484752.1 hypothetical_protein_-_conserved [Leishmania infantum]CAM67525.1 conserved hypothetical protein [Leishmania infantum JPCM5]SUZ41423.1 hypothetical_protein_-_conserved [Leishmania infantum]|eukprot:XP_001465276.1 conserved hypothetical protein [Leishmania infantum JPCM5]
MASLLRRLRSSSPSLVRAGGKDDAAAADMFLVQIIAFGEVFAVPVCKTTPVTVVLRHVMEAAVTEEQAAELGSVKATLYYKDTPLRLDAAMKNVPRNAVLHLHSSVSTTSLIVRDRRRGAVSMLPDSRRRDASTTVTVRPCMRGKSVAGGGSECSGTPASHRLSSGFAGLSSAVSPDTERQGSPAAARLGGNSESVSSAFHDMGLVSMATLPLMSTAPAAAASGTGVVGEARYYYFVPCAGAATRTPIQLISTPSRTASALSLMASRRRDSAVDLANNCCFPPAGVSPLDTAAIAAAEPLLFSPLPSPSNAAAVAATDRLTGSSEKYLLVYLRLPRDKAAACMSAAALNADRNMLAEAVEVDEVPVEALLDATMSTVATTKSRATRAYAYRRLRVLRDFPVGTLRELFAVAAEHRLHVAHVEVEDEQKTFREMRVVPNTVFYFKRRVEAGSNAGTEQKDPQRSLTRERIREHLAATATVPRPLEMAKDDSSAERRPISCHIEPVRPSAGRPFPSASAPVFSGTVPSSRAHDRIQSSASISTTSSALSIQERIGAFNEGTARNPTYGAGQSACVADGSAEAASVAAPTNRYAVEGHELTLSSAMTPELAALRTEAETTARQQLSQERHRSTERDDPLNAISPEDIEAAEVEESCIDVDCCLADKEGEEAAAATPTATHRAATTQAASVLQATSMTAAAAPAVEAAASQQAAGKAYRLHRRSPTTAAAKTRSDALHSEEEVLAKAARTTASTRSPKARRASMLVAKMHDALRGHRTKSTPVSAALTPPHHAGEGPQPLFAADALQPAIDAGEPLDPLAARADGVPLRLPHAADEAADAKPKRRPSEESNKEPATGKGATPSSDGAAAVSRATSTGPPTAKMKVSDSASPFHPVRRMSSRQRKAHGAIRPSPSGKDALIAPSLAATSSLTLSTSEEVLKALRRDSAHLSNKKPKEAVKTTPAETTAWTPLSAARAAATAESAGRGKAEVGDTPGQPKVIPENDGPSRGSGASYSQRNRRASASVPCQPVAFLGSDPRQAASMTLPAETAPAAVDISTTLEPAVLSSTRVPTPPDSHTPASILVSATQGQRSGRQRNSCTPGSCSLERVNPTPSVWRHREESGPLGYSVESPSSAHRLRITLRDPQDPTRFHYGVPVEPDCPVGALREWIAAMQRPSSAVGEGVPDLCDAKRYGIFLGDTYLSEADSVTFAEVTCGRNDSVFSIRLL